MYNMPKKERKELGKKGRDYVLKNYNFDNFTEEWIKVFDEVHEKHGSWEDRKNYKNWQLVEVA